MSLVDLLDYATSAFRARREPEPDAARDAGRRARRDGRDGRDGRDEWDEDTADETPEALEDEPPRAISEARRP
jgi:hypothetical protein